MQLQASYLYWLIVACEGAFWLIVLLALASRYLLKQERTSRTLLLSLPVVDLVLLVLTALDIRRGATPAFAHGLATAYVGFTVAFGSVAIRWADSKFARWLANTRPTPVAASRGWPAVRDDLQLWLRCIMAWVITLALLGALIASIDREALAQPLYLWYRIGLGSVVLWFILGPVWSLLFLSRRAR